MWISKGIFGLLQGYYAGTSETRSELDKERALRVAAETRVAAQQATIEWLSTWVNQLQHERSQLVDRVLGVSLPPLEIKWGQPPAADVPSMPPAPREPSDLDVARAMPPKTAPMPARGDIDEVQKFNDYVASGGMFDDMGDAAARAAGIELDPKTGTLVGG